MPIFAYECADCNLIYKIYHRSVQSALLSIECEKCKKQIKKLLSAPSNSSKITIDNGVQARSVEIIPNIIELNKERSEKDYREK